MQIEEIFTRPVAELASEQAETSEHPTPRRPSTVPHWTFLLLSLAVLVLSFAMSAPGERRVYFPGTRTALPGLCVFRSTVGIDCPGCGLTRCFISLAHGDWIRAWRFNPAGFLFFVVVAAQVPLQIAQILRIRSGRRIIHSRYFHWILVMVAFCLILQWAVKTSLLVVLR